MEWTVAAPFIKSVDRKWLAPHVGEGHTLKIIPRVGEEVSWHEKKSPVTSRSEWLQFLRQGYRAISGTSGGVITVFPQLASIVGAEKQLLRRNDMPVVSWFFNTATESRTRVIPARASLRSVDRFVVHSTREIEAYASQLHLDSARFSFVPLQYGGDVQPTEVDEQDPFVFATGSGHRDYATLFEAVGKLGYRTVVLASPHALAGTTPPPNVEILDQLPKPEIRMMLQRARVNAVPMTQNGLTAGLVTFVEAFSHNRALVATERPGVDDYLIDGENCLLTKHKDVDSMADALEAVWTDPTLRNRLNAGAGEFARANCTDAAAGKSLTDVLNSLSNG